MVEIEKKFKYELEILKLFIDLGIKETTSEFPVNRTKLSSEKGSLNPTVKKDFESSSLPSNENPLEENKTVSKKAELDFKAIENIVSNVKSISELYNLVKANPVFNELKVSNKLIFSEGNHKANVMVIVAEISNSESGDMIILSKLQRILFDKMFSSLHMSIESASSKGLYLVPLLPWKKLNELIDFETKKALIKPTIAKHIELSGAKFLVLIGSQVEKLLEFTRNDDKNFSTLFNIETLVIPSLDILLCAPERKKQVWKDLLHLSSKLGER